MGDTYAKLKIYGPKATRELEALVDTGATFVKIPKDIAESVGIELEYETMVELSDKRLVRRKLGLAYIEIEGIKRPMLISVSENNEKPLIGYTALEFLELRVNTLTRKLERAKPIEYR